MAHDLGGEHRLDELLVDRPVGMLLRQLVQRRDRVIAEDDVAVEHALGEHVVRRPRADGLQHRRHLAADLDRHVVVERGSRAACRRCDRRTATSALVAASTQLGLGQVLDDVADERYASAAGRRPRSRPGPPRRRRRQSTRAARDRRRREGTPAGARLRGGCAGRRLPFSSTIRPSIRRAASRFCARPGRARNATSAARIEKSSKSPSSSMRASGSTLSSAVR